MRSAILTSMLVSVLALATGCAASSQAPRAATAVDTSDSSWHPAEEMSVVSESKAAPQAKNESVATMPTPNKRTIVTGALRSKN